MGQKLSFPLHREVGLKIWRAISVFETPDNAFAQSVYSCNPDGSGLTVLATSGSRPRWSPDAKYIVYTQSIEKGLQYPKVDIMRIPSGGGSGTKLTADLDANKSKWAYRWTP
jgi:Tol biopolymer transport system component